MQLSYSSYSSMFFAETSHTFSTYQFLQKRVRDLFLFYLDLELFEKVKKDLVSTHSFFTLINNSRYKQNKKNPTHPFVDITL